MQQDGHNASNANRSEREESASANASESASQSVSANLNSASNLGSNSDPNRNRNPNSNSKSESNGVYPARYTAPNDREIIVFLLGMRFNGWRGLAQAALAFFRMPGMLAELARMPELGCLGGHAAFAWQNAYVMQYWDSYDALERYAKARENAHLPAWRWYNELGGSGRGAGIWHETFKVPAGAYESIYVNMPKFGLAAATGHVPLRPGSSSRERIESH